MKILVVDDQRIFKSLPDVEEGIEIEHVTTALAGLYAIYLKGPWDLVVLDHDLGVMGSGTDIVNEMERMMFEEDIKPPVKTFKLCTYNGYGRQYMTTVLDRIGYKNVEWFEAQPYLDRIEMLYKNRDPLWVGAPYRSTYLDGLAEME